MMMAAAGDDKPTPASRSWMTIVDSNKATLSGSRYSRSPRGSPNSSTLDSSARQSATDYEVEWDSEPEIFVLRKNDVNAELSSREGSPLSMEGRIALELQEMKEREDELRQWRNKLAIENCKEISLPKVTVIPNGNEELSSLHTTDGSNYSEYGSEEKEHSFDDNSSRVNTPHSEDFHHLRTQSLDSVSSGHSSGRGSPLSEKDREFPRRRVMVRPYEDPEEQQSFLSYARIGNETPIEREIRLAQEREEELRKEKGTVAVIANCRELSRKIKKKAERSTDAAENDPRGIQHRLATSRIQQEIEEANERERELRTEGKIILTSEETLDSKVTRLSQLVENSIMENKFKEQKAKRYSLNNQPLPSQKFEVTGREGGKMGATTLAKISSHNPSRKGVMQQFFSMKGKPFVTSQSTESGDQFQEKPVFRRPLNSSRDGITHTRRGYVPVAEKIQEELKDNQKREEELRLQRARMSALARSQPNLLDISDGEEEPHNSWTTRDTFPMTPRLVHSLSNPNLLDDTFDNVHKRPSSKKFSLLEEWEKRIRESIQKE